MSVELEIPTASLQQSLLFYSDRLGYSPNMSRSTRHSSRSDSTTPPSQKDALSHRRRTPTPKSHHSEHMLGRRSPREAAPTRNYSKTPSPKFMFVPMSSKPGTRAKIQPGLRASAKAHVMHDYQRKTAEKRLADWKMSTPRTYSLAPREPSLGAPVDQTETMPPREVLGWEPVTFETIANEGEPQERAPPTETSLRVRAAPSFPQLSSSSPPLDPAIDAFSQYAIPAILVQPHGSHMLDAFGTFPIQIQPWDETLITRWLNYDRIPWCPVNGQSRWIPFVTNSPVLLHTNLFCWGMHWHGKLTGVDQHFFLNQNPQILEHKIAAIQMINASLESQATVTDEILAAVSIFINISMQFLNRDEAARHMAGLEALVRLRGGLDHLSRLGPVGVLIQRLVSWNDLFFVELFGGDLRFSHLPRWEEAWQSFNAPLADDPVTHLEPLQARFAGNQAHEITALLREIQVVCNIIEARPLETLSTAERTLRHDTLFRFERRLCLATRISAMPHHGDPALRGSYSSMWRAVAHAALMYVHHHMRPGWALHWAQFRALTASLRGELSTVTGESWNMVPELQIWTLAVGSWVSQREQWILGMLREACRSQGIVTWEAFEATLKLCPNVGNLDHEKFQIIWRDVCELT